MDFLDKYHTIITEAIKENTFQNKPVELYEPINYIISTPGKKLRPVIVLMANELFGGDIQKAIKNFLIDKIRFFIAHLLIH